MTQTPTPQDVDAVLDSTLVGDDPALSALTATSEDGAAHAVRQTLQMMGEDPRLDGAAIQTVGAKHWDGFAIASVR